MKATAVLLPLFLTGCSGAAPGAVSGGANEVVPPERVHADDVGFTEDVEVVRHVTPDEQFDLMESCLADRGWSFTKQSDGSLQVDVPSEQLKAYDHAKAECLLMYPVEERFLQPFGDREYGLIYDHWKDVTVPCLERHGYNFEPLPAREVYIEGEIAGTGEYILDRGLGEQIQTDVDSGKVSSIEDFWSSVCPYEPSYEVLYGPSN